MAPRYDRYRRNSFDVTPEDIEVLEGFRDEDNDTPTPIMDGLYTYIVMPTGLMSRSMLYEELCAMFSDATYDDIMSMDLASVLQEMNMFVSGHCIACTPIEYNPAKLGSYLRCSVCHDSDLEYTYNIYSNIIHILSTCCPEASIIITHYSVRFQELFCNRCAFPLFFPEHNLMMCENVNL